jgi:hypothetical protein
MSSSGQTECACSNDYEDDLSRQLHGIDCIHEFVYLMINEVF